MRFGFNSMGKMRQFLRAPYYDDTAAVFPQMLSKLAGSLQ